MRIEEIQVLHGPNVWTSRQELLVQMRLDLEEMEERPTDLITGFGDRLQALMPGLYEHRCSPGVPGGFFQRVATGTWMGHVIEHIALELQVMAGMNAGFGRTRGTGIPGVYFVVFNCMEGKAGLYAAVAGLRIAEALIAARPYDLQPDLRELRRLGKQVHATAG